MKELHLALVGLESDVAGSCRFVDDRQLPLRLKLLLDRFNLAPTEVLT